LASAAKRPLELRDGLPFVSVELTFLGRSIEIAGVLVDTGAARTILSADVVERVGIAYAAEDVLRTMRGVGGSETVYTRTVDRLAIGARGIDGFTIQVGGMDYGFEIHGIVGMDFLRKTGAVIDLRWLALDFADD
jgi:predicted aspartyl protease